MAGNGAAVVRRQPHFLGLGDQVSDGQHETVGADHDTLAHALGPERIGRKGIGRNRRAQGHDRGKGAAEVIIQRIRIRLELGWNLPLVR
jgi:hypothetical protein